MPEMMVRFVLLIPLKCFTTGVKLCVCLRLLKYMFSGICRLDSSWVFHPPITSPEHSLIYSCRTRFALFSVAFSPAHSENRQHRSLLFLPYIFSWFCKVDRCVSLFDNNSNNNNNGYFQTPILKSSKRKTVGLGWVCKDFIFFIFLSVFSLEVPAKDQHEDVSRQELAWPKTARKELTIQGGVALETGQLRTRQHCFASQETTPISWVNDQETTLVLLSQRPGNNTRLAESTTRKQHPFGWVNDQETTPVWLSQRPGHNTRLAESATRKRYPFGWVND